jgi:hypothetical protein
MCRKHALLIKSDVFSKHAPKVSFSSKAPWMQCQPISSVVCAW